MDEYISCKAAIEALSAEALERNLDSVMTDDAHRYHRAAQRVIAGVPAADVRPVVMCKDCKWTKTDGMEDHAIYCEKWDRWEMPPDGFCWLGKKRKEINNEN